MVYISDRLWRLHSVRGLHWEDIYAAYFTMYIGLKKMQLSPYLLDIFWRMFRSNININLFEMAEQSPMRIFVEYVPYRRGLLFELYEKGFDPFVVDKYGNNALHIIATSSLDRETTVVIFRDFIEVGVDVNGTNIGDSTPLHLSMQRGHRFMPLLLSYDADVFMTNKLGQTPIEVAIRKGHHYAARMIEYFVMKKHQGGKMPELIQNTIRDIRIMRTNYMVMEETLKGLKSIKVMPDSEITYYDLLVETKPEVSKYLLDYKIQKKFQNIVNVNFVSYMHTRIRAAPKMELVKLLGMILLDNLVDGILSHQGMLEISKHFKGYHMIPLMKILNLMNVPYRSY